MTGGSLDLAYTGRLCAVGDDAVARVSRCVSGDVDLAQTLMLTHVECGEARRILPDFKLRLSELLVDSISNHQQKLQ